jgi:Protein of unknown function (DUF2569)
MESEFLNRDTGESGTDNRSDTRHSADQSEKIRGSLLLVAIGLILSLLRNLGALSGSLRFFFSKEGWVKLADSASYNSDWKPLLIYDLASDLFILIMTLIALVLFFQKKRTFPKLVLALIPVLWGLSLISYYWTGLLPGVTKTKAYGKAGHALIAQFIGMVIWGLYFLFSKRVRKTFVR